MTKDVLVSIRGLQFAGSEVRDASTDEELDKIETICPGQYYFRDGAHYILYEELAEEFSQPVKNVIKIRDKEFTLTKRGPVNVQMLFAEGKKTITDYSTPFGNILIALDTKEISVEEDGDSMNVHIGYGLEANYQFIADCNVSVGVKASNAHGPQEEFSC